MACRSQNERPEDREASRVHQLRRKLGVEGGRSANAAEAQRDAVEHLQSHV